MALELLSCAIEPTPSCRHAVAGLYLQATKV